MNRINIEDINFELEYEGYIWYSNQSEPEQRTTIRKEDFTLLPFIVEGNLYSKKKNISISIKHIDGEYQVFRADLSNLSSDQLTKSEYLAHKLDGIDKIKMIQYWEESEKEELLSDMTTLKPSWQAFQGFIKK